MKKNKEIICMEDTIIENLQIKLKKKKPKKK